MIHHLPIAPLRWTHAEGVWLAKGTGTEYTATRETDCLKRCWSLYLTSLVRIGTFRTLGRAKHVAQLLENG